MIRSRTLSLALALSLVLLAPLFAADAKEAILSAPFAPFGNANDAAKFGPGWTLANGVLTGESPEYYSLPETKRGDFVDDSWSYHTVFPVALWRYALPARGTMGTRVNGGGHKSEDYKLTCDLTIEKPAPLKGFRGGETFFNYQWGREAIGSDAAIVLRHRGPDDNYMLRFSSGYGHVELWKTHGGVVQVRPCAITPGKAIHIEASVVGATITASVDGKEIIRYTDPVEPILEGYFGLAVRESRSSFSKVLFQELFGTPDTKSLAPVAHKPDFKVRDWVGKKYIFDGDEPIAWVFWNPTEGIELREMKLAPGLMPFVLPCASIASYDFKPEGEFKVTAEGATLAFNTKQMGKNDAFECTSSWTLTYAAGEGYTWDKRVKFTANADRAQTEFQIDDPFFYQMVAPATGKLPAGRGSLNYTILERTDGKLIAYPNAHHCWTDGLADTSKQVIRNDGANVTVIDGWGVAVEMPSDNSHRFTTGYCHWGLDLHLRAPEFPAKGQSFEGHMRYRLWDRERVKKALAGGALPEPAKPNPTELFKHVEPVNGFHDLSPGLTGESVRLWTGKYAVDHQVGRGDKVSMRVNAGEIKSRTNAMYGDERPNCWQGSSYWMGPYLAPKYKIGCWVKADSFKGKVTLLVDNITWPKPREPKEVHADLAIDGKCDWTYISFETEIPHNAYSWVVRIDATGEGTFWVDDVELSPVPTGK